MWRSLSQLRFPRPIPGFRPWFAFLLRQPSFPLVFCFFCPLPISARTPSSEEMELQRARRRRDELGHEPLCDRIRRGVFGKTDTSSGGRHVTAHGPRVDPERSRRLGERSFQHVAQHEGAEVRPS